MLRGGFRPFAFLAKQEISLFHCDRLGESHPFMCRVPSFRRAQLFVGVAPAFLLLGACASLPSSGPTGMAIRHAASAPNASFPYKLIDVTTAAMLPPPPGLPTDKLIRVPPRPTDLLGPGDVLDVTVYEAGVALFGQSALSSSIAAAASGQTASTAEHLPTMRVDDNGYISVPFVGRVRAAGRTASELAAVIQSGLRGMSQDPQVLVTVDKSITNSIILAGEVNKPGRLVLDTNRESLIDAIALAGGYRGEAKDAVARVQREGEVFEVRLSDLMDFPQEDLRVAPGDRITLVSRPQSFSVLGAPNRAEEIKFPRGRLSLAEAVASSGGANPNQGDAAAIFVFRYVVLPDGTEQPTVYHFDMMQPGAYLLSQRFMMRDRDVLYVGNARANQLTKFVQLLSQLFVPVATVRATVQ
jgi:polysaccharide export outer membrane protein